VAYQSLYRRYRPGAFSDIVGQAPVVRTLSNSIAEDRLHHAYLFTGPRGTGKTSIARILAKAVNCVDGPTASPCGVCESCVSITAGTSLDVIELDMASHGGVDDARDLRERAQFAPTTGRRKVYILDEVHMASTAAFNALLKLVEEPPGHVLFAMATTDPQKVLPTILSRVQRLDLRRVAADEVAEHVRRIVTAEGSSIDDVAVDAIVRAGDGSVRDTLSILEQVLAFAGGAITGEHVGQVLGSTASATIVRVADLLTQGDLAGLLTTVAELVDAGQDLRRFTLDLVGHLRDLLVLQAAPDHPELVDATRERRDELVAQAARVERTRVLDALEVLAATVTEQRQGTPRLPLELAFATLTMPRSVAPGVAPQAVAAPPVPAPAPAPAVAAPPAPAPEPEPAPVPAPVSAPAPAPAPAPEPKPEPEPAPAAEAEPGHRTGDIRRRPRHGRRSLGCGHRAREAGVAAREGRVRTGHPDPAGARDPHDLVRTAALLVPRGPGDDRRAQHDAARRAQAFLLPRRAGRGGARWRRPACASRPPGHGGGGSVRGGAGGQRRRPRGVRSARSGRRRCAVRLPARCDARGRAATRDLIGHIGRLNGHGL
jgi:DNA polymerase III subunit gamma/tau